MLQVGSRNTFIVLPGSDQNKLKTSFQLLSYITHLVRALQPTFEYYILLQAFYKAYPTCAIM